MVGRKFELTVYNSHTYIIVLHTYNIDRLCESLLCNKAIVELDNIIGTSATMVDVSRGDKLGCMVNIRKMDYGKQINNKWRQW